MNKNDRYFLIFMSVLLVLMFCIWIANRQIEINDNRIELIRKEIKRLEHNE